MAVKRFIIEVEEGMIDGCDICPFQTALLEACKNPPKLSCYNYDLSTMKIQELISYEELRKFANRYSHNIWEQLMQRFEEDDKFYIGANDVSDYVLNAILDTYQKMMEEEK